MKFAKKSLVTDSPDFATFTTFRACALEAQWRPSGLIHGRRRFLSGRLFAPGRLLSVTLCFLVFLLSGVDSAQSAAAASASTPAQAAPKDGSQSGRRYVNLPKAVQAPFSDGVLVGNTLYIAGRLGLDPKTGKLPDDVEQEARIVLDGVKSVLIEAGMTMDDLVFVQVFCPDVSLYPKFNEVYKTYFGKDYPARAFVGSGPLLRGAHFEINGIAVKR